MLLDRQRSIDELGLLGPPAQITAQTSSVLGDRPTQVDAARGESRPEGRQHNAVAVCEAPLLVPLGEGNRNCPAHGIPVAIEIDDHAVEAEPQALGHCLDDAPVGF